MNSNDVGSQNPAVSKLRSNGAGNATAVPNE